MCARARTPETALSVGEFGCRQVADAPRGSLQSEISDMSSKPELRRYSARFGVGDALRFAGRLRRASGRSILSGHHGSESSEEAEGEQGRDDIVGL